MTQQKNRHCDFVYNCFYYRFKGPGWYVVGCTTDELGKPETSYKIFHGPFSNREAKLAMKEFYKDLGRPLHFKCDILRLTAKGKISSRQDIS